MHSNRGQGTSVHTGSGEKASESFSKSSLKTESSMISESIVSVRVGVLMK
jgi:hypothetical protein